MTTIPRGPDAAAALGPFLRAIRSHLFAFVLVTLAALGGAAALLAMRSPTYETTAELLVTPLQQDDRTFLGIPLLRDSGDPTRTVQTAAALIASPLVAGRTATKLGGGLSPQSVEDAIQVEPIGESNLVGVTARAASPSEAARLANAYAESSLALRAEALRTQIVSAIAELRALARRAPGGLSSVDGTRLTELSAVRDRGDPSLSLSQPAELPGAPSDAPAWLVLALALVAGLTLGAIVAVLIERLNRRVRDVDELLSLAPVPVLASVPAARRRELRRPALEVPAGVRESFKTLQMQIDQRRGDGDRGARTIVVTSGSSADGKTTTAICLALALANAGHRAILVDCDLRWPDIGPQLGLDPTTGLVTLLTTSATLEELLQPVDGVPGLRVLTAAGGAGADGHLLTGRRVDELLVGARSLADYIVIDTAPLGLVGDALALTPHADVLLLVGRARHSDRRAVHTAVQLLERAHTPPTGWVVIGEDRVNRKDAYYYAGSEPPVSKPRRRRRRRRR